MLTIDWVSDRTVAASGTVTVRVTASDGATVSFKLLDAADRESATKTVADGGPEDLAALDGVIETALEFSTLFDRPPESGNVKIYAGTGDEISIPDQTFDAKAQVNVDADAPTAAVESGASAQPNDAVEIDYAATDVPDNARAVAMQVVGQDGTVHRTVTGLDQGRDMTVQFTVPAALDAGAYDLRLVIVDEVGHEATDVREDGLVVKQDSDGSADGQGPTVVERTNVVDALEVLDDQPVAATGTITVSVIAGATVSFKVRDAAGTISATRTVDDGGPDDRSASSGLVETTLDLDQLFDRPPKTGVATVYAGRGDDFSVPQGTFGAKRQVALDADEPTVGIASGVTAGPGQRVKVTYTVTDVPQKVRAITLQATGPDGNSPLTVSGLQPGRNATTQIRLPSTMDPDEYDLTLVATDEAGHRTTDRLENGLVVTAASETTTPVGGLEVVSDQPVAGSGTVTVRADAAAGSPVAFKVQDAAGTISATETVTEGGSRDRTATGGTVEATLDLRRLFEQPPESGTAVVYAGSGEDFGIAQQGFDTKREVEIDAGVPTVAVTGGATGAPGEQVKIGYEVTDVPQKVRSITLTLVAPDGTVTAPVDNLQVGTGRTAQFTIPTNLRPGRYDVRLVAVDEVGYRAEDILEEGLVVSARS